MSSSESDSTTAVFRLQISELGPFPSATTPAVKLSGFIDSANDLGSALVAQKSEPLDGETTLAAPGLEIVEFTLPIGPPGGDIGNSSEKTSNTNNDISPLTDRIASQRLTIEIIDAAASEPEKANLLAEPIILDLRPFLHERTKIGYENKKVKLADLIDALWDESVPDPTEEEPERTRAKVKVPTVINLNIESLIRKSEAASEPVQDGGAGSESVTISSTLARADDSFLWNVLEFGISGIHSLPEELINFDNEATSEHWFEYEVRMWDHTINCKKIVEQRPNPDYVPPSPRTAAAAAASEEDPNANGDNTEQIPQTLPYPVIRPSESSVGIGPPNLGADVDFQGGGSSSSTSSPSSSSSSTPLCLSKYVGPSFLNKFQSSLNHIGGTWVLLVPKLLPSSDPKAAPPAPDVVANLKKKYTMKAWLDVRKFLNRGCKIVIEECALQTVSLDPEHALDEDDSKPKIHCFMRLHKPLVAKEEKPIPLVDDLLKFASTAGKIGIAKRKEGLPDSLEVTMDFMDSVVNCIEILNKEHNRLVEEAKRTGQAEPYDSTVLELKLESKLRSNLLRLFTEYSRKSIAVDTDEFERNSFLSRVFAELAAQVIPRVLRNQSGLVPPNRVPSQVAVGAGNSLSSSNNNAASNSLSGPSGAERSGAGGINSQKLVYEEEISELALKEIHNQRSLVTRSLRLAEEAEICGNWDACANYHRQLLTLAETKENPKYWMEYARFLCRARDRNLGAEAAVKQAIALYPASEGGGPVQSGTPQSGVSGTVASASGGGDSDAARKARCMLAALLIDRRRYQDADSVLQPLHVARRYDPMANLLLGLNYYLAFDDIEQGINYLFLATKPKEWFRGITTHEKLMEKLQIFLTAGDAMSNVTGTGVSYSDSGSGMPRPSVAKPRGSMPSAHDVRAAIDPDNQIALCLQRLLEFGLPKLVFTVLDTKELAKIAACQTEVFRILEAEALTLQEQFDKVEQTLEQSAFQDVKFECHRCRLLGEAKFRLSKFEEANFYLGSLLHADGAFASTAGSSVAPCSSSLITSQIAAISGSNSQPTPPGSPSLIYPTILIRLGHTYLLASQWQAATEVFLRSIRERGPLSETWVGVAFAAYREDDIRSAFEALREANWLDDERPDVWAFLTLVHLRMENLQQADDCFRQTLHYTGSQMSDELLLEIGLEYLKHSSYYTNASYRSEAAARTALSLRETGQAHEVLGDSLVAQNELEKAVLEFGISIRLFYDQPKQRELIVSKALKLTDEMADAPLAESIHIAQKMAQSRYEGQG